MNFNEYCHYVKENILEHLPEEFADAKVFVEPTMKNNSVVLQGLVINKEDNAIVPKVYLDGYFEQYKAGKPLSELLGEIAEVYKENDARKKVFDVEKITSFENAKNNITTKVVNAKQNKQLALERPNTRMDDLAVFYKIEITDFIENNASVPITNELMAQWNISLSELHDIAVENTERFHPSSLRDMGAILTGEKVDLFLDDHYEPMGPFLVLSNDSLVDGASAIANPVVMEKVGKVMNDDFFILPSSVHELLILPKSKVNEMGLSPKELGLMVREVNGAEVSREDQLSDHIYSYDRDKKMVESCKESMKKTKDMER